MRRLKILNLKFAIAVILLSSIGLLGFRNRWVTPEIFGKLNYEEGKHRFNDLRVILHTDDNEIFSTIVDADGRFHFQPLQRLKYSLPGDTCFVSQLEIEPSEQLSLNHKLGICTGELLTSYPSTVFYLAIDLSPIVNAKDRIREKSIYGKHRQSMSEKEWSEFLETGE